MADLFGLKAGHPQHLMPHVQTVGLALSLCAWPAALAAQVVTRPAVGVVAHPALAPGGRLGVRTVSAVVAVRWGVRVRTRLAEQRVTRGRGALLLALYPPSSEPVLLGIPPDEPPPGLGPIRPGPPDLEGGELVGAIGRYADLNFQLGASLAMRMDQFTNERCTVQDISALAPGCQGGFPTPVFDQSFNLRVGGIVGERLHVNVDYDTERDFSANNNINVYYQGREDEIVRRVDIGNVPFNPPPFRFITAAIPENSFGAQVQAQLGAFEFTAIVAQQRGSQLRTRVYTVGEITSEPVEREVRDLDYERGRFFSVLDPRTLPDYPAVDLLNPSPEAVPASRRPAQVRVYRLRSQALQGINPNLGGIDAIAIRDDSPQRVGPFPWELLLEGRDYYLDPSGLWFALQSRLGDNDFLAVSYVTAAGDTVGTFPSVNRAQDTLFLLYEPRRGPEAPTFHHEVRNSYRVGAETDLDRRTLGLRISVNESEQPLGGSGTYLQRLGLSQAGNPDVLDESNRVFPRTREPNAGAPIRDLFLVFPHLVPFADSARLQAGERNDSLYRTPTYLLASQGPPVRARLRLEYEAQSGGDRSLLSLGAFQIRDGTEKILVGDRELVRGQDYEIDYTAGQVRFLNPDLLFPGAAQVTAQFEENQAFDIAPTSLIGLSTRYNLGSRGSINVIGLLQRESSQLLRPTLGFEPQATFVGGLSTQLLFRPDAVTRALNALPLVATTVPSTLTLNGELAISRPNPNSVGQAWIEEFENTAFRPVGLGERSFRLGSLPSSGRGLPPTHLDPAGGFAAFDAVPLVWQNIIQVGERSLTLSPRDIDSTIVLVGTGNETETVLWLSLKPDTVGGVPDAASGAPRWLRSHTPGPRWRSLNQPFDNQGLGADLSRTEFLEFWVLEDPDRLAQRHQAVLVFDFGTVFEDAVAFGPNAITANGADTTFSGFQFLGVGRLDSERDSLTGVFNAGVNDLGLHGDRLPFLFNTATGDIIEDFPTCSVEGFGLTAFPLGDLGANCTRGNGFMDSEDLNGDNRLDVTVGAGTEDVFRYVFPIGDDRFFVRSGGTLEDTRGRNLVWRLYRMPFREDTLQVGTPNIRQIRAMRLTMVVPDQGGTENEIFIALARMRLVGAPWVKRAATPIAGLAGAEGLPHGEVVAAVVTTENRDLGYTPPPGVLDQANQRGAVFDLGVRQVNETSLRLLARDLRDGERAEAFIQFPDEAGKSFLRYRTLRAWARGRGPGWEDGDLQFFIRVGRDEHNFYLYRTPARTVSWEPEVVVSLERWLLLRADIEGRWLRGDPPGGAVECGVGDPTAYVACDGGYLVQVRDPGVAPPNLARVTEMAVGMYRERQTVFVDQAELWVDDIRLSDVVEDIGVAGAVDVRLTAADVGDFSFGYQTRDANFQQIGQEASFVTDAAMRVGGTLRADKLLPPGLGLNVPISLQHTQSEQDPFYLNRSDVRGDALVGLRRPTSRSTSLQVSARRTVRGGGGLERLLFDPWNATVGLSSATSILQLAETETTNRTGRIEYRITPGAATTAGAPGFLRGLVGAMPAAIAQSEFGRALRTSRLRVNPFQVRGAVTLTDNRTSRLSYRAPVVLAGDTALTPLTSRIHALRAEAGGDLRPYSGLGLRVDWASTRDLRDLGDTTTVGRLVRRERRSLLGRDVGYEQLRTLNTAFTLTPTISAWLRPRFSLSTVFSLMRDPNGRRVVRVDGDTAGAFRLPETMTASRQRVAGVTVDAGRLARNVMGTGRMGRLFAHLLPLEGTLSQDLRGTFDRPPFSAPPDFQLALGGVDDFRLREGVPATSASQTDERVLTGGTRLPVGFLVRGTYRDQTSRAWTRRFGTADQAVVEQRSRDWPSGSINWVYTPRGILRHLVANLSASLIFRETEAQTIQSAFATQTDDAQTETHTSQLTPNLTLTFPRGVVATGRYNRVVTDALTAGNTTTTNQSDWNATVNFRFRPPASLVRLENEIQTTVIYNASETVVCLLRAGTGECTEVSQNRRRSLDVRMETGFSLTVRGGAALSLVRDEARHLSSRTGRVSFTIFADIFFDTGQFQ